MIRQVKPSVIVNASAYTAVDRAESEPELARLINADAPGVLAEEAAGVGRLGGSGRVGGGGNDGRPARSRPGPARTSSRTRTAG